jgi:hypothetical protein
MAMPLFQTGTEKQILHCRIDLEYLFLSKIFSFLKRIFLTDPCSTVVSNCYERIVFDFHDNTRLFHIVYLGIINGYYFSQVSLLRIHWFSLMYFRFSFDFISN